jgi:hypothetical protein
MDIGGLSASLLAASASKKIVPVLLIDKIITRRGAERYLKDKAHAYVAARSSCTLTFARDVGSVDILDKASSASSYLLSPVLQLEARASESTEKHRGGNPPVLVGRQVAAKLVDDVSRRLEIAAADIQVLEEDPDTGAPELASGVISAYSDLGLDALAKASYIFIADECADIDRWIGVARRFCRPVAAGLIPAVLDLWGSHVVELFNWTSTVGNEPLCVLAEPPAQLEVPADATELFYPRLNLSSAVLSHSWEGYDSFPLLPLSELVVFHPQTVVSPTRRLPSADRFCFGSTWMAPNTQPNDSVRTWSIAGRCSDREKLDLTTRVLISNSGTVDATVKWVSPVGAEVHVLGPEQRAWIDIQAKQLDAANDGLVRFDWIARDVCRPIAFIITPAGSAASWSNVLGGAQSSSKLYLL